MEKKKCPYTGNKFSISQYEFIRNKSCQYNLILFCGRLARLRVERELRNIICCDHRKAFDTTIFDIRKKTKTK